ncbi:MAG: hypothetical protein ACO3ND_02885 [Opitutales bacterium]
MILLLGASGHVGQAFCRTLDGRELPGRPLARSEVDYTVAGDEIDAHVLGILRCDRTQGAVHVLGADVDYAQSGP